MFFRKALEIIERTLGGTDNEKLRIELYNPAKDMLDKYVGKDRENTKYNIDAIRDLKKVSDFFMKAMDRNPN
tara:strand:- start:261 stop:476 length:216 start_codon:yes stop_codon:yes gene_type:complete